MFLARKRGMNAKVVDKNLEVNNVYSLDYIYIPDNLKESSTLNSSWTIFLRFISHMYRT